MTHLQRPVIYVDLVQAESRALVSFLNYAKIDYETRNFAASLKSNPGLIKQYPNFACPFLVSEATIGGAHAICRYLANSRLPEDNQVYPSHKVNPRKR